MLASSTASCSTTLHWRPELKVVVITGASSGIGEATANLLASKGAMVVLGARRADNLKRIADEIKQHGGHAVYQELDVTRQSENDAIVKLAKDTFGRVDAIFLDAGLMPNSPLSAQRILIDPVFSANAAPIPAADRRCADRRDVGAAAVVQARPELITCTALVALGMTDQMASHFPRALVNGVTKEELIEMITHMAFYAGWPKAVTAALKAGKLQAAWS